MDIKRSLSGRRGEEYSHEVGKKNLLLNPPSALQLAVSFQPLGPQQTAPEQLRSSSELSFKGSHFRSRLCVLRCSQHGPADLILFLKGKQPVTGELLTEIYLPDVQRCTRAICPHSSAENISHSRSA
ncbi:hypothetical protein CRENBAI_008648 [Crenichthys baileyi]|uniref:Uncharacterized protein n=1 Tax=Crenichthys baileyi TaxID=28760 RepID=A0AAV9RAU7_9TELE